MRTGQRMAESTDCEGYRKELSPRNNQTNKKWIKKVKRYLNRYFTKEDIPLGNCPMKRRLISLVIKERQMKTTSCSLKFEKLTPPNVDEAIRLELLHGSVGIPRGTTTLKNILMFIFLKIGTELTIWSSHSIPRYIPKRGESIFPHKDCMRMFIAVLFVEPKFGHCSSIHHQVNG